MTASSPTPAGEHRPGTVHAADAVDAVPDLPERFDEHYLTYYSAIQKAAQAQAAAALIVKLLDLAPGAAMLDVPCAYGRIANQLAARGCRVTGLDAKRLFLERARRDAEALGVGVEYVAGDMRALPGEWEGRFDAVVNWFISFGYLGDDADRLLLREWRRVLRPGGRLIIEHANLTSVARRAAPGQAGFAGPVVQAGDGLLVFQQHYDPVTGHQHLERVIAQGGRVERHAYSIRYFSFPELRDWLLGAGFSHVDAFGGGGAPLTLDSGGMIVVAQA